MSAQADRPAILPTVPGRVAGVVCLEPFTIQCQECGVTDTADTVGLPWAGRQNPGIVVVMSDIRFHPRAWSGGQTGNPRLCADCRKARRCTCDNCRWEFR